jgi:hypothetical protein
LESKIAEYNDIISKPYLTSGMIKMPAIRHLGILIYDILYGKGTEADHLVPNPAGGGVMPYIPWWIVCWTCPIAAAADCLSIFLQ